MLTLFWCSTLLSAIVVFWMLLMEPINATTRWLPWLCRKSVSGLRRLDKIWVYWDAYKFWAWCSNVVQTQMKGNWIQQSPTFSNGEKNCFVKWSKFFRSLGQVLGWKFLVLRFYGNFRNWIPKLYWSRMNWLWSFFVGICFHTSTSGLHRMISSTIAKLLLFSDVINFFGS